MGFFCVEPRQDVPPITFLSECPAALHTAETLWVPVLIQSGDHFLQAGGMKSLRLPQATWGVTKAAGDASAAHV